MITFFCNSFFIFSDMIFESVWECLCSNEPLHGIWLLKFICKPSFIIFKITGSEVISFHAGQQCFRSPATNSISEESITCKVSISWSLVHTGSWSGNFDSCSDCWTLCFSDYLMKLCGDSTKYLDFVICWRKI